MYCAQLSKLPKELKSHQHLRNEIKGGCNMRFLSRFLYQTTILGPKYAQAIPKKDLQFCSMFSDLFTLVMNSWCNLYLGVDLN
jgi:hypothetical protein